MSRLMTVGEAAERLGFSRPTVLRAVRTGQMPASKTPGGHNRLRQEDVEAFALKLSGRVVEDDDAQA